MLEQFDIHSKIFFMDVGNFFRYLCVLVLRYQMPASNYFVNSFYSAGTGAQAEHTQGAGAHAEHMRKELVRMLSVCVRP
jgi:hypothetical protein